MWPELKRREVKIKDILLLSHEKNRGSYLLFIQKKEDSLK
jgi:hypothetical protein